MRRLAGLWCLLGILAVAVPAAAKFEPDLRWSAGETEHFRVYWHQGGEETAARAAAIAEEAHRRLTERIGWSPKGKTALVLADVSDAPNGYATPFPSNQVVIYLARPLEAPGFGAVHRDDWLRLVINHEYAHVLQLDMVRGFPKVLRHLFGRLYFPNSVQPMWLIEGPATFEETEATSGGRGRSPGSEMIVRMAVLEKRLPSMSLMAVAPDDWPAGEVPYIFGESFFRFIVERHGREKAAAVFQEYSGRLVPFLVDSTARRALGEGYRTLYADWKSELERRYAAQAAAVDAAGPQTPMRRMTQTGYFTAYPAFSPDGSKLAWYEETAHDRSRLMLAEADGSGARALTDTFASRSASGGAIAWHPRGDGIYYTKIELHRSFTLCNDLWFHDLQSGRDHRLTRGLRARDPHPSPDGTSLLFVVDTSSGSHLAALPLDREGLVDGEPRPRWLTAETGVDWAVPRWSPVGSRIAATLVRPDGSSDIVVLDQGGRVTAEVTRDRAHDSSPAWSADGQRLYFASDRTGIFNIFVWESDGGLVRRITNVLGGVFTPAPSSDGRLLAVTAYSADGHDVALVTLDESRPVPEADPFADRYPPVPAPEPPVAIEPAAVNPLPELLPRFWLPYFAESPESGSLFGLLTAGTDVLQRHTWMLTALYGPDDERFVYGFDYAYDRFRPTLSVHAYDTDVTHFELLATADGDEEDYTERWQQAGLSVAIPFLGLESSHLVTLEGFRRQFDALTDLEETVPSDETRPAEGVAVTGRLTYDFVNYSFPAAAVSPEDGRRVRLSVERSGEVLDGDYEMGRYLADWTEFVDLPWRHHVLRANLFYGHADGDLLPQRAWQIGGDSLGDLPTMPDDTALTLRGYAPNAFRGQKAAAAGLEYRFPLLDVQRGGKTAPFFFRRLHGALFAEGASAWDDDFDSDGVRTGVGAELRLDMVLGYFLPVTLRLVVAKGLDDDGESQGYLSLWIR
jgi:hypothetical protein